MHQGVIVRLNDSLLWLELLEFTMKNFLFSALIAQVLYEWKENEEEGVF